MIPPSKEKGFYVMIFPRQKPNGEIVYTLQSRNKRIPEEVIITSLRTWLRGMEDTYYEKFKANTS